MATSITNTSISTDTINVDNGVLYVDNVNNRIGVGTTSPSYPLHINGSGHQRLLIQKTDAGGDADLQLKSPGDSTQWILFNNSNTGNNSGVIKYTHSTNIMDFRVNNSDSRLAIDGGNVYVGKATASGDVTTEGVIMQAGGKTIITNNTDVAQNLVLAHYNSTGSPIAIEFYRNSSVVGSITKSAIGTTYNTTSDIRLKDNIVTIADGKEKLLAMNPVTHTWKEEPNAPSVHGFIAQEMQHIVPEAVNGDPDSDKMMSMDYGRITPVIVAALQDALKEIDELKTRISELESKQ